MCLKKVFRVQILFGFGESSWKTTFNLSINFLGRQPTMCGSWIINHELNIHDVIHQWLHKNHQIWWVFQLWFKNMARSTTAKCQQELNFMGLPSQQMRLHTYHMFGCVCTCVVEWECAKWNFSGQQNVSLSLITLGIHKRSLGEYWYQVYFRHIMPLILPSEHALCYKTWYNNFILHILHILYMKYKNKLTIWNYIFFLEAHPVSGSLPWRM